MAADNNWIRECNLLKIICPNFVSPPHKISLSSLATWIPIPLDIQNLICKIDGKQFSLSVTKVDNMYKFVCINQKGDEIVTSSPYNLIEKITGVKNHGWGSIYYLGHSLIFWRRQYIITYISNCIQNLSPKIRGVQLIEKKSGNANITRFVAIVHIDHVDEIKTTYPDLVITETKLTTVRLE
jgi:hypothetical protein